MTKSFEAFITKFSWFCYGGTVGAGLVVLTVVLLTNPAHGPKQTVVERPVGTKASYEPVFVPLPAKTLVPPESFARFMAKPKLPTKHKGAR